MRRALAALCVSISMAVGALVFVAPEASAKDGTYTTTVRVKQWDEDARRDVAQKAANKGCRDDDHDRATIRVKKGHRAATYKFDCVAGTAIDL
jgi:hypothetical protein